MSRARDTADQINRINSSAANATAITVDSSGDVGIGNTVASSMVGTASMTIGTGVSGEAAVHTVYSNSNTYGALYFADSTSGSARYQGGVEYQHPQDSLKFITSTNERIRIDSDGLKFHGDTAAANALNDYEEGTHQTVATMTGSGTVTLNTSFDRISYTKVGRLVTIIGNPRILTVSSPVGQLKFTLPFTAKSGQTDECRAGFIVYYYDNTAGSGSYTKQVNATVNEGTNVVKLDLTNTYNNNITADSSDEVLFSFSYITA